MLTIGLTGGIGSGKSTVAHCFAALGIEIIDTDQLARDLVAPSTFALKKIVAHFGEEILNTDQSLDRKKLRTVIFSHPKEKTWLENLLHPLIRQEMQQRITQVKSPYCIVVIPLLIETQPNPLIHRVLVVDAPEQQQIERAALRDQVTPAHISAIIHSQASRQERLAVADDVICNDKGVEYIKKQVLQLHQKYLYLANKF